jgi:hypothetical protein
LVASKCGMYPSFLTEGEKVLLEGVNGVMCSAKIRTGPCYRH